MLRLLLWTWTAPDLGDPLPWVVEGVAMFRLTVSDKTEFKLQGERQAQFHLTVEGEAGE